MVWSQKIGLELVDVNDDDNKELQNGGGAERRGEQGTLNGQSKYWCVPTRPGGDDAFEQGYVNYPTLVPQSDPQ
jgi:hypothetical protein